LFKLDGLAAYTEYSGSLNHIAFLNQFCADDCAGFVFAVDDAPDD
jgi:hypothetical protein